MSNVKNIRKFLSRLIYKWADHRYGVTARGHVKGFTIINGVGRSDFSHKQRMMFNKWHFWMDIKNKVYGRI